ncbi:protein ALP1-like [Amaranthus tricolor]|uniref:protein ALP1-like n=1 Tax=Amaranthus tricolor TaxID=29722 RepID=UPI002589F6E3|nr:protein ALP1-like [Amaranthus tricolor]
MDRIMQSLRRKRHIKQLQLVVTNVVVVLMMYWIWYMTSVATVRGVQLIQSKKDRKILRLKIIHRLIQESDVHCKSELRVNRKIFNIICEMLKEIGGLTRTKNMSLDEINFLGALDGTYINVTVHPQDRVKYRTRKGTIAMNVLGVCAPNMQFIYVLLGWEGSTHDVRVLRNALTRPNGFMVPRGNYYLVDGGYTNCEGFLAPYRGQLYQLKEWTDKQLLTVEEYYNMKHARARNVIERCFGLLKGRWSILRSPSFFPIRTQGRIVMACCLLHNLIRKVMLTDDVEEENMSNDDSDNDSDDEVEYITTIVTSDRWTNYRNTLAQDLFNSWRARVRQVTKYK